MSRKLTEMERKQRGWYWVGGDLYYWRNCDHCGLEYCGMGKQYCSKSCNLKDNPIYNLQEVHPMKRPEIVAIVAAKLRGRKLSAEQRIVAIAALSEGRKKIDLAYRKSRLPRGKEHHAYIEDRTKLKDDSLDRGGQLHREWSRSIKNRDSWSCRIADVNCDGRLEAHHILSWKDFPELRYEVNNGITLCQFHHPRKVEEAKSKQELFNALVAETVSATFCPSSLV